VFTRSLVAALILAAPRALEAQGTPVDSTVRRFRIDASSLRAGQFVYQLTLERDTAVTPIGTRIVSVSEFAYGTALDWLILETRSGATTAAADSLIVTRTDLQPVHWGSTLGGARLGAEFVGDSLYGAASAPQGKRSLVATLRPGVVVNAAMLETALRLLPIQAGWQDSTTTLAVSLAGVSSLPTQLAVIGDDRVRVPAGTFDCWIVAVDAEAAHASYWVTKRDAMVVKSAQSVDAGRLVSVLARATR
jgi:hypothetical protein